MDHQLTFYVDRDSSLHKLNPLTKIVLVFSFIITAFTSPWYPLPAVLIAGGILPLTLIAGVQKEYTAAARKLLLPVVGFLFVMQSFFHPDSGRVLLEVWFLDVSVGSLRYAFLTASRIFVMVSAFILLLLTTHPSVLMSDLTRRGLSGSFAYVITSTLQILPQMRAKASTIIDAQRSRGLDTEGGYRQRFRALLPLVGPLVFGSLVEVEERAIAIEARAFTSTAPKTFLTEIPDSPFDQALRWVLISLTALTAGSNLWL